MVLTEEDIIKFETKMREINPEIEGYLNELNKSSDLISEEELNKIKSKKHNNVSELMKELTIPFGFYVKHYELKDEEYGNTDYKDNNIIDQNLFEKLYSMAEFKNGNDEDNSKMVLKQKHSTKKNRKNSKAKRSTKKK